MNKYTFFGHYQNRVSFQVDSSRLPYFSHSMANLNRTEKKNLDRHYHSTKAYDCGDQYQQK